MFFPYNDSNKVENVINLKKKNNKLTATPLFKYKIYSILVTDCPELATVPNKKAILSCFTEESPSLKAERKSG